MGHAKEMEYVSPSLWGFWSAWLVLILFGDTLTHVQDTVQEQSSTVFTDRVQHYSYGHNLK